MNAVTWIFTAWAVLIVGLGVTAFYLERKWWNKGRCPQCGGKWQDFDTDSSGSTGYHCGRDHHVWLSWPRRFL